MGVAVLSGIIASLETLANYPFTNGGSSPIQPQVKSSVPKWEAHTPGTSTPVGAPDASLPSRFIACVNRDESVKHLQAIFHGKGGISDDVEIVARQNLSSIQQADVILLW